jgi:peptidyl-prolyl cis-trans isomerase A (cyclophilin A)
MRSLCFSLSLLFTFSSMLFICGCSDAEKKESPEEVLAKMEKLRNEKSWEKPAPPSPPPAGIPNSRGTEPAGLEPGTGTFTVKVEASTGDFTIEVNRAWAPVGAERFYQLVKSNYFDECRFFRVVPGFMVQFGMNGNPATQQEWDRNIKDDPVTQSNKRSFVTFATSGPDSRTTQLFINFDDNASLDGQGFAPFGKVIEGMEHVDAINAEYGESPDQGSIKGGGNAYLNQNFPRLDYIKKMSIISETK